MKTIPYPGFCGGTYPAISPLFDPQRTINMYPEPGLDTSKSRAALIGRPGLSAAPFATMASSPVRQLWAGNSRLFAVSGTHVYEVAGNGTIITDYGAMAGSTGLGPATVVANGTQLLVCDLGAGKIYNANPVGPTINSVFNGAALEYLDGFYVAIAVGASLAGTNPNQINVSDLDNGTTWNALNFIIRKGAADLVNQLAVLNGQLWIFGQKSIEVWYNAGNPLFPFARIPGAVINLGCLAPSSVVKFSNTIMWLGGDDRGYPQVYMTQGLNPIRVSNFAIEQFLQGVTLASPFGNTAILPNAWAFGYQEAGHSFFVLNIPNQNYASMNMAVVYDLTTKQWHERIYVGPWPVCFASIPGTAFASAANFAGDLLSGAIYKQSLGYPNDGGTPITYTRVTPTLAEQNKWLNHDSLEVEGDVGTAQMTLEISNNGGRTFPASLARAAISGSNEQGGTGVDPRFIWKELGRSRKRTYRLTITNSANLIRLTDAFIGLTPGDEQ